MIWIDFKIVTDPADRCCGDLRKHGFVLKILGPYLQKKVLKVQSSPVKQRCCDVHQANGMTSIHLI